MMFLCFCFRLGNDEAITDQNGDSDRYMSNANEISARDDQDWSHDQDDAETEDAQDYVTDDVLFAQISDLNKKLNSLRNDDDDD